MRRTTRKALTNLALFVGTLFTIIYLGTSGGDHREFAWTTIRYQTSAKTLPKSHGVCPGLEDTSKPALVVSRVAADGNAKWLESLSGKYHLCVYDVDDSHGQSTVLRVPANRGHEAMAYLTFMIDNYSHIPEAGAVFVHGSRWAWHNDAPDYDNAYLLELLNVSAALESQGYHNLRCDWSASTCEKHSAPPQGSLQIQANSRLEPWNARLVSDAALPAALSTIFGGSVDAATDNQKKLQLGRADAVRSQCCAQFVVSRARVWQHAHDEYIALRQWLLDEGSAPGDDRVAGRIISYLWHILFLKPPHSDDESTGVDLEVLNSQACPRADECYCRLYGRCNLDGCSAPGYCFGQYAIPPDFKLPEDWGKTHS
ncbi:hypothetical protein K431DRAFT_289086 [Polychaeton citri CBS 116435]|uniref:Uncharacterized protein n=1 Tax=Polychaeton citri CBS 116435 TaxID=1314669 RepID=A0A9P4UIF4_9PEZI|nr:hypothetical protein K431DRAFT_289086 [Polychaeton citri CBS 116435]